MSGLEEATKDASSVNAGGRAIRHESQTAPRRRLLKEQTRAIHSETDRFTREAGFFRSRDAFISYLRNLLEFHSAHAAAVQSCDHAGWHRQWNMSKHTDWLRAEITKATGLRPGQKDVAPLPGVDCPSSLLGSLYVIAGSTMGAPFLHRLTIAHALPFAGGSAYLKALAGSLRWPEFLAFLESAPVANEKLMLQGALATFEGVLFHLKSGERA